MNSTVDYEAFKNVLHTFDVSRLQQAKYVESKAEEQDEEQEMLCKPCLSSPSEPGQEIACGWCDTPIVSGHASTCCHCNMTMHTKCESKHKQLSLCKHTKTNIPDNKPIVKHLD